DSYGDPLPPGALARLGTTRLRHSNWVNAVAMSPDGKTLASCSWDRTIRLWDPRTGKEVGRLTSSEHPRNPSFNAVFSICFTPDGKALLSGTNDGTVRVWDLASRQELRSFGTGGGTIYGIAASPDGKVLACTGGTATSLLDVVTGEQLFSLK